MKVGGSFTIIRSLLTQEKATWRKGAIYAAMAAVVAAALLYYRFRHSPFEWSVFAATFEGVRWPWLSAAAVLSLLTYPGRALRWQVMLRATKANASFRNIHSATLIGFTAVFLLGRPGELVRPYLIAAKERVPFSSQMAAWMLERIFDLLVVVLIFGFSLARISTTDLHLSPALSWVFKTGGYVVTTIGVICLGVLLAFRNFSNAAQDRVMSALTFLPPEGQARIASSLSAFSEGMAVTRETKNLTLLILYSAMEWLLIVAGLYALFHAFPVTSGLRAADVMVFVGFSAFGSIVQIPGIGGGYQVVSILILTELFGIAIESATGLALLIWVLSFVLVAPFGLGATFREGLSWRRIKHIQEDIPT